MAINFTALITELENAVRGNLHNFDNMYQAVSAVFHHDLDGKTTTQQNSYIIWFMQHFGYRKLWIFRVPTTRRIQLLSALVIGRKFSHQSTQLAKLITAGEAVLNNDVGTFKVCFMLV